MPRESIVQQFIEAIDDMYVVDHHEHLGIQFSTGMPTEMDLPYFLVHGYLRSDLVSAGLPAAFAEPANFAYLEKPCKEDKSAERWKVLLPFIERVRSTIYYRYLLIAMKDLFGAEEADVLGSNWERVSNDIRRANAKAPDWGLSVLDRTNIKAILLDRLASPIRPERGLMGMPEDPRFVQVVRMDMFLTGALPQIERVVGRPLYSFDAYLEALDRAFQSAVDSGARGIKSARAYGRIIRFEDVPRCEAEKVFAAGLQNASWDDRKKFEDYMMHAVCERCAEHELPLQIHTGIQAGNFNTITNANPTHLTNLFQKFVTVRFDIFHGGYPYCSEAGVLAKYFPNVYVDGCWLAHISPSAYQRALEEWIEICPASKIFAWGGDHRVVEHSYASLKLAKRLVAEVLAKMVQSGYFTKDLALDVARQIMGENGKKVYGLPG